MELLKIGFWNGGEPRRSAKMVGESGFLKYVLDFLVVFPARHDELAGIILKLK